MAVTHLADEPTADATPLPATDPSVAPTRKPELGPGAKVEVRRRFDDKWARGFEVIELSEAGFRLLRLSDSVEIPATFPTADVRKEPERDMWWY